MEGAGDCDAGTEGLNGLLDSGIQAKQAEREEHQPKQGNDHIDSK
jgi:hypothetical protein